MSVLRRDPRVPRRSEYGLTFIELLISVVLMSLLTGGISAAFVTAMNDTQSTNSRVVGSNDAQVIAAFLVRDAQAAGGVDPTNPLAIGDSTLGVSLDDAAGCGSGNLVFRFSWRDWIRPGLSRLYVVNYFFIAAAQQLVRVACIDGGSPTNVTLANHVASYAASCNPTNLCPGMPDSVSLRITETNNPPTSPSPYTFTLRAAVRPQGQVPPSGGTPLGFPALLALGVDKDGNSVCPALSVSGSTTTHVGGDAVVNGTDATPCTAMQLNGNSTYSTTGVNDLASGGTCGGNNCPGQPIGSIVSPLPDPFATMPAPGDCSGPDTGAFGGGHYSPGVYQSPVNVSGTVVFDPGNYIFCSGLTFKAQSNVTATGVLFYVANGAFGISGQAQVAIAAAPTGTYAGVLVWIPKTNATTTLAINGGSTVNAYSGLIYAPNVDVTLNGGAGSAIGSIIARSISFSGGGHDIVGIPPVAITGPASLPNWTISRDYPGTPMTASGGTTPYTWSQTGLPAGLSIDPATGLISGTPSATGTSSVTVTVTDSNGQTATKSYSVTINPSPTITGPASLPDSTVSQPYPSKTVTKSGGTGPFAWAASGLPTGMSINASSGVISGTPTVTGTTSVAVTVTDTAGASATQTYSMTINPAPSVTTPSLPEWTVSRPGYNTTVAAGGGTPPYTWSATGLPSGLSINANTGAITGTPGATAKTFAVVVTITDAAGAKATKNYNLTINSAPTISSPASPLPSWTIGRDYPGTAIIAANGTTPYTWGATGLPTGMSINGSGVIVGTPGATGTFSVSVTLTDAAGASVSMPYSLTIKAAPTITTTSLPDGEQGLAYNSSVAIANGTSPFTWAASGLPAGLTINASTGAITGTPTANGTASVTFTVTDTAGAAATTVLSLNINTGPSINTTSLPNGKQGTAYTATVTATGGVTPYTWSATGLPTGLGIAPGTGVISGTPSGNGTFSVNVTVKDAMNATATQTLSLTVTSSPTVTSTNPSSGGQGATNKNVTVNGTNFVNAAGLAVSFSGTGITVNSTSFVSPTQVTANVTIAGTATVGARDVTVTNPDGGTKTGTGVFSVNAAPTISPPLSPNALGQGATSVQVTINGTGFAGGATVSFSGTGVSVANPVTVVGSTQLKATVTVALNAAPGLRDVTVTNPDSGTGTLTGALTVNAGPTINTISPASISKSTSSSVTISGTGFVAGAGLTLSCSGTSVSVSNLVVAPPSTIAATFTANNRKGTCDVTVTNPDNGSATALSGFSVM